MAESSLSSASERLAKALQGLSNPVSSADFGIRHVMKRVLHQFIKSIDDYDDATPEDYPDIVDDFLNSVGGKGYIAWFQRSSYNSNSGKMKLVSEILSHA